MLIILEDLLRVLIIHTKEEKLSVVQRIIAVIRITQEVVTATVVRIRVPIRIIHEAHLIRMQQVIRTTLEGIQVRQITIPAVVTLVIPAVAVQVLRDLVRAVAQAILVVHQVIILEVVVQVIHVAHRVIIQAVAQVILVARQAIVQEAVVQAIHVVRQVRAQVQEVVAVDLLPLIQEVDKSSSNRIKKEQVKTCSFFVSYRFRLTVSLNADLLLKVVPLQYL